MGYAAALLTSISIIVGARVALAKTLRTLQGNNLIWINSLVIMTAGGIANACNVAIMRRRECLDGIQIRNEDGTVEYGDSI